MHPVCSRVPASKWEKIFGKISEGTRSRDTERLAEYFSQHSPRLVHCLMVARPVAHLRPGPFLNPATEGLPGDPLGLRDPMGSVVNSVPGSHLSAAQALVFMHLFSFAFYGYKLHKEVMGPGF